MAESYRPIYTTVDSVKVRLANKVAFGSSGNPRAMSDELLGQLIVDAETAVEQDLRGRYAVPFVSIKAKTFQALPDHTKRAIRTIVDTMAVVMILRVSFGSGGHVTGDPYLQSMLDQYPELLRRLLGQDMEGNEFGERRFRRTPPLEDLKLAATNVADDGYRGAVLDARPRGRGHRTTAEYAVDQASDPSQSLFWNWRGTR